MTDRIALSDLGDPRFPDSLREILDLIAESGAEVRFDPQALMAAASADTGLHDYGDDWFREPLAVLCRALESEAGLSNLGRASIGTQLVGMLKNRLLVESYVRDHPDALDVRIDRPIIVAGLPRTGTTHLHNMLSADPSLRHMPYWESLEPLPLPGETGIEPRRQRAAMGVDFLNSVLPHFAAMHEMTTDHAHEEIQLLALTFSTMLLETLALMPSYRDWWNDNDQTPAYEYCKRVLQVMQHARGGTRWVLKSPQHLAQFRALQATFPDATFVVTHRDPLAVTVSLATMVTYTARLHLERVDPLAFGDYWAPRVEQMLDRCLHDRDLLPADQSIDIRFDEFMADEWATIESIYALADQPLSDASRAAINQFLHDHPRGRHGAIDYRAEPLGIDPVERARALKPYAERFGVPVHAN